MARKDYVSEASTDQLTISEIAKELGISKTTVSRSISGKGRISAQTRRKVLEYVEAHNYTPNPIARGLAQCKTYNIGLVIPGDAALSSMPFFQLLMIGVCETAGNDNYDVLVTMTYDTDISRLERLIKERKVDGIILGRTLENDINIKCLKKGKIPFVVVGSTEEEGVIQIDNDHVAACSELTSILLMKGMKKLALIGASSNHIVSQSRLAGFLAGLAKQGLTEADAMIYTDCDNEVLVDRAVDEVLRNNCDCIVCMDDQICYSVLVKLGRSGVKYPEDIKVASFYNSTLLERSQPAITALQYEPEQLGNAAAKVLIDKLEHKEVKDKTLLSYEVVLKGSTL